MFVLHPGKSKICSWFCWGIGLSLLVGLSGCNSVNLSSGGFSLNSRYNDEQPSLSGDGRYLAFVSNRNGNSKIYLYNLQQDRFVDLPGLSDRQGIMESPSLSRTGRYIVYIASINGRPDIILYDRATQSSEILTQAYRSWLRNPRISADGRYIVFETSRRNQWDVEMLDRGPNIELDITDGTTVTN
jgi:Tol biopolymer transport system component